MRGGKYLILLLSLMALLVETRTSSHAVPTLRLTDGTATVTIEDEGLLDINPLGNWVTFLGRVGPYWYANVTTGSVGQDMAVAHMNLSSVNSTRSAGVVPPDLNIQFSEVGFTGETFSRFFDAMLLVGGTTHGTVTFTYWLDDHNTLFGLTTLLGTLGLFGSGAFSGSKKGYGAASSPFSLTLEATLHHPAGAAKTTSFSQGLDQQVQSNIPEPITLILYGLGFLGAGLYRRLRRPK